MTDSHFYCACDTPSSVYLSGAVADSVQFEQVRGVRDGVVLGDGGGKRSIQFFWVCIDLLGAAQTLSELRGDGLSWRHGGRTKKPTMKSPHRFSPILFVFIYFCLSKKKKKNGGKSSFSVTCVCLHTLTLDEAQLKSHWSFTANLEWVQIWIKGR